MLDMNRGLWSRAFQTIFAVGTLGMAVTRLRDFTIWGVPILPSVLLISIIAAVGIELRNAREKFG